jgi:hypothetical protein
MAKLSWHDRILAYMVEHGYQEIGIRSEKYRRFVVTVPGEKYRRYVLGKNGNVRRELLSESGSVIASTSVTELYKRYVVRWEQSVQIRNS